MIERLGIKRFGLEQDLIWNLTLGFEEFSKLKF